MVKIKVYIHAQRVRNKEKINCICLAKNKGCNHECELQEVDYDQYQGWKECYQQNRYGK